MPILAQEKERIVLLKNNSDAVATFIHNGMHYHVPAKGAIKCARYIADHGVKSLKPGPVRDPKTGELKERPAFMVVEVLSDQDQVNHFEEVDLELKKKYEAAIETVKDQAKEIAQLKDANANLSIQLSEVQNELEEVKEATKKKAPK